MKRKLLKTAVAVALSGFCLPGVLAQDAWDAPQKLKGVDVATEDFTEKTYALYNVGADAFVTHGADYNTQAVAGRLFTGDAKLDDNHKVTITKVADSTRITIGGKTYLGLAGGDPTRVFVDNGENANNVFDFSDNGDGTFTLTPKSKPDNKLDVSVPGGWRLTCDGGQSLTNWALIPEDAITKGNYAIYKAKKEMYEVYEAVNSANTSGTYTTALTTAKKTYDADDVSADSVRAATATLLKAAASGLTAKKVNASSLFTNADMASSGGLTGWNHTFGDDGNKTETLADGVFETWHCTISLKQEQTNLPNGIYAVVFHGFYRNDGSDPAPTLTLTSGDNTKSANLPDISSIDFGTVLGDNTWKENKPNQRSSAGEAMLISEETTAKVEDFIVKDGKLAISIEGKSTNQWIPFQGFDIYYQAEDESSLKATLQEKKDSLSNLQGSPMSSAAKAAVEAALETAGKVENGGETEALEAAIDSVNAAITTAEASIAAYKKMGSAISYVDNRLDKLPAGANTSEYEALKKRYEAGGYTDENVQKEDTLLAVYAALATAAKSTAYEDGKDYTLAILNNGFETGELFPGWEATEAKFDATETAVKPNSGNYEMPEGEGDYLFNSWGNGGNYGVTLSQTVEDLPEGIYKLGFLYGSSDKKELTVIANGDTATFVRSGANTGPAQHDSLIATVGKDKILSITVIGGKANDAWYKVDNFTLTAMGVDSVPLNITAENQWATLILPFDANIPEKLTVYSCGEEVKDGVLSLTPQSKLAANTPYIVYAESGIDTMFTGLSTATEDEYTVGCMTGTFVEKDAPVGSSYVLGKQNGVVAFYKVEQKLNKKVGKYHAYLNASAVTAGTNVQVLKFPTRDLPSHVTAATAEAATVDVYSISGILVRSKVAAGEALKGLPKGIYIVNGEKKAVK